MEIVTFVGGAENERETDKRRNHGGTKRTPFSGKTGIAVRGRVAIAGLGGLGPM